MELPSLQPHRHIGTGLASTHPSPTRVPTAWAQNLGHRLAHSNERGWVCTRGTNIQTCTPTALPTVTAEATYRPNPAIPHWLRQGPPGHSRLGPTNSWLYVPLLVGRLAPAAEQAWLQDAHGNHEWQQLVQRKLHPSCGNSCAMHRRFYKKLPPTLQETCPPARRPSRPLSPGQQHTCHQQRAFTCRGH